MKHEAECRSDLVRLQRPALRQRRELGEPSFSTLGLQAEEMAPPRQFLPVRECVFGERLQAAPGAVGITTPERCSGNGCQVAR